ncbi:MAG: phosphotransferase [Bacteroidetes bacterium]|nr:phosphotransferase [Bacteroidota bacterium]
MHQNSEIENKLQLLFKEWYGSKPESLTELPHSGSSRRYYRIKADKSTTIGAYNDNYSENLAFVDFTRQLSNSRVNVPQLYTSKLEDNIYLIEDLGEQQLLSWLLQQKTDEAFSSEVLNTYKKVIRQLVHMQIIAGKDFDYSRCHQHAKFDKESIIYDLNYFKTYFIDSLQLKYNRKLLQADFETFANYLLQADNQYFMFRDFQARNIIIKQNEPYFIDYQGGRQGPLQYDLASLLFQAKAQIPEKYKTYLLEDYIQVARLYTPIDTEEFKEYFFAFAMIRVLQTLGAYGLRGLIEKKQHFIESIPLAIANLKNLNQQVRILENLPDLQNLIEQIINTKNYVKSIH